MNEPKPRPVSSEFDSDDERRALSAPKSRAEQASHAGIGGLFRRLWFGARAHQDSVEQRDVSAAKSSEFNIVGMVFELFTPSAEVATGLFGNVKLTSGGRRGNITNSEVSRGGSSLVAPRLSTLERSRANPTYYESTDVGLVKEMTDGGICILVCDPASSNAEASQAVAQEFVRAFHNNLQSGRQASPGEIERAFNVAKSSAGGVSYTTNPEEPMQRGYCTALMAQVDSDLEMHVSMIGDGCIYIQGFGFIPNSIDNSIEDFGGFDPRGFAPNAVGGLGDKGARTDFHISLKAFRGSGVLVATDALTKMVGLRGGELPQKGQVFDYIEDLFAESDPTLALVRDATMALEPGGKGVDDIAAAYFKL